MNKIIYRISIFISLTSIFLLIILFAKGYRINPQDITLTNTGILAVNSYPKAAKIYINNKLIGVSDSNINLPEGQYKIKIDKEGYKAWEKLVFIKNSHVIDLHAHLFTLNPSLKPLTFIGIKKIYKTKDPLKFLLLARSKEKNSDSIYLTTISNQILGKTLDIKEIITFDELISTSEADIKESEIKINSDVSQAIIDIKEKSYLITFSTQESLDITESKNEILQKWLLEEEREIENSINILPKKIQKLIRDKTEIISISPDETKILYQSKENFTLPEIKETKIPVANEKNETRKIETNKIYLYDKKTDKNFFIDLTKEQIENTVWHPDSLHLVYIDKKNIKAMDIDGNIIATIYSGPFEKNFISITNEGNLLLLINLNKETSLYPDLYEIQIN